MNRPLNIHPDIWKLRNNTIKKQQVKQIQLDQYTKLNNSIDMFVQSLQLFKNTYESMDLDEYSKQQKQTLIYINNIVQSALIPYTIDIVKQLKFIQDNEAGKL